MEFGLLAAAVAGVFAVWATLRITGRVESGDEATRLFDVAIGAGLGGLVAGRLWAMISTGVNPLSHPGDALIVRSGVDTIAASLGAAISAGLLARGRLWNTLDGLAPAGLAGLAAWHGGCLFRDACLGTTTSLPWGVSATLGGPPRHPVEIYTAVLLLALAVGVALLRRPGFPKGLLSGLAIAAAGLARAVTEPLRPTLGSGLAWWYWAMVAAGAALVVAAWSIGRSRSPG